MDQIVTQVRELLGPGVSLLIQSPSVRSSFEDNTTILWNSQTLNVDTTTHEDFQTAIKRRGAKHYAATSVLSYPAFCVALLCCSRYTLNHTTTPTIPPRAYTAAWRGILIVAATAKEETRLWLASCISFRSAEGYCSALNISNSIDTVPYSTDIPLAGNMDLSSDEEILSSICSSDTVIRLNNSGFAISGVDSDSFTPEGQLLSLLVQRDHYHCTSLL